VLTVWHVARKHVSAADLGTSAPWIRKQLAVNADYYVQNGAFVEFKDRDNKVVFALPVAEISHIIM
jgi:hypothetical protein